MPTKIGGGHQMQEYDPATGRYGYGSDEFAKHRKTFLNHSTGFKAEKKETERMAAKESPYKGGSPTHHSLRENIQELSKIYPINEEGYFVSIKDSQATKLAESVLKLRFASASRKNLGDIGDYRPPGHRLGGCFYRFFRSLHSLGTWSDHGSRSLASMPSMFSKTHLR